MSTHFETPSGTQIIDLVAEDKPLPVSLVWNAATEEITATYPNGEVAKCWTIMDIGLNLDIQTPHAQRWLAYLEELEWVPTHQIEYQEEGSAPQRWTVCLDYDGEAHTLAEFTSMKNPTWTVDADGEWRREGDENHKGTVTVTKLEQESAP